MSTRRSRPSWRSAAGVVYPVTDSALNHTSPVMIATLRALAGGALLTILLPFFVALIARFALNGSITRLRAIGLVIGFAGVLLVILADPGNVAHGSQLVVGLVLALVIGGQVLVYLGFNAALSRWPSTRVYAWTFLVPVVAVAVEAIRGALPGIPATIGVIIMIIGVAIVNLPSAEGASTAQLESQAQRPNDP